MFVRKFARTAYKKKYDIWQELSPLFPGLTPADVTLINQNKVSAKLLQHATLLKSLLSDEQIIKLAIKNSHVGPIDCFLEFAQPNHVLNKIFSVDEIFQLLTNKSGTIIFKILGNAFESHPEWLLMAASLFPVIKNMALKSTSSDKIAQLINWFLLFEEYNIGIEKLINSKIIQDYITNNRPYKHNDFFNFASQFIFTEKNAPKFNDRSLLNIYSCLQRRTFEHIRETIIRSEEHLIIYIQLAKLGFAHNDIMGLLKKETLTLCYQDFIKFHVDIAHALTPRHFVTLLDGGFLDFKNIAEFCNHQASKLFSPKELLSLLLVCETKELKELMQFHDYNSYVFEHFLPEEYIAILQNHGFKKLESLRHCFACLAEAEIPADAFFHEIGQVAAVALLSTVNGDQQLLGYINSIIFAHNPGLKKSKNLYSGYTRGLIFSHALVDGDNNDKKISDNLLFDMVAQSSRKKNGLSP